MRRWNGWGEASRSYPLPEGGRRYLTGLLGPATPLADADLATVLADVPASRLPEHPLIITDAETRVRHARGQSLPDWLALRSGSLDAFPDGVARPAGEAEVRELLAFAERHGAAVIPWGGGTSVAGHVTPQPDDTPVVTIDLARLNQLYDLDEASGIATFGAGTPGPQVEAQLRARGYTLGHFPQSWELSTLGGWIATRSSGQQSLRYGRIEQLFAGGHLETPRGSLEIPTFPASAAGPDLREWVMGTEGRAGIVTRARVRVSPLPPREEFRAVFFPSWSAGMDAAREAAQRRLGLSMVRLSDPSETETQLQLAGRPGAVRALRWYLARRGITGGSCLLLFAVTGSSRAVRSARRAALCVFRRHGGVHTGRALGEAWRHSRFRSPYLRESLWSHGYAVDTLETAADWRRVPALAERVDRALRSAAEADGAPVHVFSHLSHVYPQGSSIYTTYVFPVAADYAATYRRWASMKRAASEAIVGGRGTISHQHGVGVDHAPYLPAEKGVLGLSAIRSLCQHFDPVGIMNPGKLYGSESR